MLDFCSGKACIQSEAAPLFNNLSDCAALEIRILTPQDENEYQVQSEHVIIMSLFLYIKLFKLKLFDMASDNAGGRLKAVGAVTEAFRRLLTLWRTGE